MDIGADEAGSNPADFNESGTVDFADYSFLSAAWMSQSDQTQWNETCDISDPPNDVIDMLDLHTFLNHWLWQAWWHG